MFHTKVIRFQVEHYIIIEDTLSRLRKNYLKISKYKFEFFIIYPYSLSRFPKSFF